MPATKQKVDSKQSDRFVDGEKVLCYHGPLLYEAKVNKVQYKEKVPQYLVHYSGWSKSWDEWVPDTRVLKINEANLQKQKELLQQNPLAEKQKRIGVKRKIDKRKELEIPSRRRRCRLDMSDSATRDCSPAQRPEIKIVFTDKQKKWLVDDWDLVTRQKQLVRLPKVTTVRTILALYQDHVKDSDPDCLANGQIAEVCDGLRDYFDVMLGTQLLYKFERPQYSDMLQNYSDKAPSEIYGIEHLLRLFVRLGGMLRYTAMEDDNLMLLQTHIHNVMTYLDEVKHGMEYNPAPAEYHRRLA